VLAVENMKAYEAITTLNERLRAALVEVEVLRNRLQEENVYLQDEIHVEHNYAELVGSSPALLDVLRQIDQVAPTDATVLVDGETGTGKELVARAIHKRSLRHERPLVKVNSSAISAGLVESELFGHVKGAFTGAIERHVGRFALADQGTIFLDEVGELPLETQVKLLRVLQEQEFEPVGSNQTVKVDVRVIAATNRNLTEAVREGRFRADLFYRLNVVELRVPPLRERAADIPQLAMFFLGRFAKKFGGRLRRSRPRPWNGSSAIRGRGTFASCRTSSSAPSCSLAARPWSSAAICSHRRAERTRGPRSSARRPSPPQSAQLRRAWPASWKTPSAPTSSRRSSAPTG
jgi:transcriptional regulator with GAF, ATPase, and Fis domain